LNKLFKKRHLSIHRQPMLIVIKNILQNTFMNLVLMLLN